MPKIKNISLLLTLLIYLILTIYLSLNYSYLYVRIINPIFWLLIILFYYYYQKTSYLPIKKSSHHFSYIILLNILFLLIIFLFGFKTGFTKSPLKHDTISIIKSIYLDIIPLIGIEISRYSIITKNKNNKLIIIILTILLILININYETLNLIKYNHKSIYIYICSNLIPLISNNILASFLCYKESYYLSLTNNIIKKAFFIISPLYPNFNWFIEGTMEVIKSTFIYLTFKHLYTKNIPKTYYNKKRLSPITYACNLFLIIFLICFMLGLFKYELLAIKSNSMSPIYNRGDILIYEKVSIAELKNLPPNTIIIYKSANKIVAHRITKKVVKNNLIFYQTKGDNNNKADPNLVLSDDILGIYKFHIKYLGYPTVWLNTYFTN